MQLKEYAYRAVACAVFAAMFWVAMPVIKPIVFFAERAVMLFFWSACMCAVIIVVVIVYRVMRDALQLRRDKTQWRKAKKDVLFIYSDNSQWKEYCEKVIIPHVGDRAQVWNWSHRFEQGWSYDHPHAVFFRKHHPQGFRCPVALIIPRHGAIRVYELFQPSIALTPETQRQHEQREKQFFVALEGDRA